MQGLHKEGEYQYLEFWTWKSYVRDTYSAHLQMSWNFTKNYFGIYKNIREKKYQGAPTPCHALVGSGPPSQPSVPILWYIRSFALEKIRRGLSGRSIVVSRQNLGKSTFALRWSDFVGDTSLREGELKAIVIITNLLIMEGPIFINIFNKTISSQNLWLVPVGD